MYRVCITLLAFFFLTDFSNSENFSKLDHSRLSFGEWRMGCEPKKTGALQLGSSSESSCFLFQHVASEADSAMTLLVMVVSSRDYGGHKLRVLAPLGVLLPSGMRLKVDSTLVGRLEFSRCFPEGCFSEIALDPELTERLKKGKDSFFIVFPEESQGVGFPISLKGLTAGLQNLP
jgi:invasion protein IalB